LPLLAFLNDLAVSEEPSLEWPPEVILDRYFRSDECSSVVQENYIGKQDLDLLEPALGSLLRHIQMTLNESLREMEGKLHAGGRHPRFHFDYLQAKVSDAIAFEHKGYFFIAITMPLTHLLWRTCETLSKCPPVLAFLEVSLTVGQQESTHAALFWAQLSFILLHEYRHLCQPEFATSLTGGTITELAEGSIESQAREVDADGYAVYHLLTRMMLAPRRPGSSDLLAPRASDEALLSLLIVAVGAFFYARRPVLCDIQTLYELTHPPQAARMNEVMHSVQAWSRQNRPTLESWLTLQRFQTGMHAVEDATWGTAGKGNWSQQTTFLSSEPGVRYFERLHGQVQMLLKGEGRITEVRSDGPSSDGSGK
jgi:hypothetical protein